MIITAGAAAFGCISGITAIGWSGGAVSDNTIYVGSREGRLVALNLLDDSRQWSETIKAPAQGGLLGCGPSTGGGCGTSSTGVAIYGTPVLSGELVYIAGYNGKIYAYTTGTLGVRWVYPREGYLPPFVGGLIVNNGKLFVGGSGGTIDGKKVKGRIYALDATTGDPLWHFDTEDKIWSTPAISGGTLYIGSFDKKLYAIDITTGKEKWAKPFETQGAIMATPLIYQDTIYFGAMDRNLYAVSASNGQGKVVITAENWFWAEPVIVNNTIYAGSLDGKVYVLRADTGAKVTTVDLNSPVSSRPVIVDNAVIFATRKGVIYSINTVSNQATQLADIKLEVDGPLTAREGIVYIHTQDLALKRVNTVTGAVLPPISLKGQD
jgi:outer membrane protein assembly factor BamB